MQDFPESSTPQQPEPCSPCLDAAERVAFSRGLRELDLLSRIHACLELLPGDCGLTTGFGYSGMILLWAVRKVAPRHPIYFIDTGYHFPETLAFKEKITDKWNLNVITLRAESSQRQDTDRDGVPLYMSDSNACCFRHKVAPLLHVLPKHKAWIHALRRDQSSTRQSLDFAEMDATNVLRLYPLIDWTRERCWFFIESQSIPVHPLHRKGYASIGCQPCTRPVGETEHERAGRWDGGVTRYECGLHTHTTRHDNVKGAGK